MQAGGTQLDSEGSLNIGLHGSISHSVSWKAHN